MNIRQMNYVTLTELLNSHFPNEDHDRIRDILNFDDARVGCDVCGFMHPNTFRQYTSLTVDIDAMIALD